MNVAVVRFLRRRLDARIARLAGPPRFHESASDCVQADLLLTFSDPKLMP